jgi:protein arginine N-methyltransferase 1
MTNFDEQYFASYSSLLVHELMLKDTPRTLAYKEAVLRNRSFISGKVVLDIGAGTGILSLFAAKFGGAKAVIAVEAGAMAHVIKSLAIANGVGDVVHVVNKRVEEIDELPLGISKVDVIISEWMGFYLFHESMLNR